MAKQSYTVGQVLTSAQMTALQLNDYNQTVSTKTASYTLVAADAGTRVVMNSASATTITVNTSLFTAGDTLFIHNIGAGNCTVTSGTCTVAFSGSLVVPTNAGGTLYFTSASSAIFFATGNIDSTVPTSGRNKVLNGDFKHWQRGTSTTVSGGAGYTADRWNSWTTGGGGSVTTSQQVTGDTTNLPNTQYCARFQRVAANTNIDALIFGQPFESVQAIQLAGQTVVVSFYARKGANYSSASNGLSFELWSTTGTDTSLQTMQPVKTNVTALAPTLTATWQKFSCTGTVATSATQLAPVFFYFPVGTAGAADYFEVTDVQVEQGSVATPFEFEAYGVTLAKCQRFYEKSYNDSVNPATANSVGDVVLQQDRSTLDGAGNYRHFGLISFKVTKRTAPTMTLYSQAGTSGAFTTNRAGNSGTTGFYNFYVAASADSSSASSNSIGQNNVVISGVTTSAQTLNVGVVHYVASAEL